MLSTSWSWCQTLCDAYRYWKVPEESHLVFRSPSMAQHAVALINNQEWVSGGCDGTLQVGLCTV